jgi:WD40 repeat protein
LDKTVKLWDLEYGKPILTIQDKLWNCTEQFSTDGFFFFCPTLSDICGAAVVRMTEKYVIAGGEGKIRVIDPRARGIVRSMKGHKGYFPPGWITSMQADENKIITGSYNRQIKIWDFNSGACINSWRAHTDKICSLQFDHHQLVTASRDRTLRVRLLRSMVR